MEIDFLDLLNEVITLGVKKSVILENRGNSVEFFLEVSVKEKRHTFSGVLTLDGTLVLFEDIDEIELPDLKTGKYPVFLRMTDTKTLQFSAIIDNMDVRIKESEGKYEVSFGDEINFTGDLVDSSAEELVEKV